MPQPNVLILRAPGTNCDQETGYAFDLAGGNSSFVHINQLIEAPEMVRDYQILCLPGGFSYGDDIAAGRILASQMQSRLADVLSEFHASGKLILGICNGFQILIKSGFLLPSDDQGLPATLTWNDSGRFVDCWVNLKTDNDKCVFLNNIEQMYLPIAHAEGKFVPRNEQVLDQLKNDHQLALSYCLADGSDNEVTYPHNPNGSTANVAGVCDASGRIFGLMPHPERFIDPTHHPRWTREGNSAAGDGLALFQNAINFFND
ncbi:phosphoribosylformylglycinamidine synthase I [Mariniblastus sp.]|jgi:phosphoribosylformylglycinamidine synthase subunit PurQ / glutaminase|nr:phosphoribosylformylglycinamidine synthase I [Mariniblastus sp.]MDB4372863.1 phosphoribosylformylglycinamidine synthase I [Mariniblastus sp.]MDB4380540.1 phosphoribosylformylglycinamidine synthase I [Mariniblastus sp.]